MAGIKEQTAVENAVGGDDSGKERVQMDFPPSSVKRFEDLKTKCEAVSRAEVVRNARRVYEWLVNEDLAGKTVAVTLTDKTGKMECFRVFI